MSRKAIFLVALWPLVWALPQMASAETIFGAMSKAYENNPDINAARAGLRVTDEGVTIAKATGRPQISGEVSGTLQRVDNGLVGRRDFHSSSSGITITQQIFDGFQTVNNVRAATASVFSERENVRATEMQILLSAAQAYADIARDQQLVGIRKQNLAFLREQLNASQARLDVGEGTRTDVSQAQAELAAAQALLVAAVAQLKTSEAVYVQIVGAQPVGIKQPAPASRGLPRSLDQAVASGLRQHPSILAAQYAVDSAGFGVKAAEGAALPGVRLEGTFGRTTGNNTSNGDNTSGAITARLSVPIYQGGAEYGRIRQTKEQLGQQRILVDRERASVQQNVVSAYAQMEAAIAQISANRQQLSAANLALAGVVEERNVGQRTTLDVLISQQNVLDAQESLAVSQRNAVVASYSLLAAMGNLTVGSQNLQVAEYRSEKHFEAVKDKWFGLRTVDGR